LLLFRDNVANILIDWNHFLTGAVDSQRSEIESATRLLCWLLSLLFFPHLKKKTDNFVSIELIRPIFFKSGNKGLIGCSGNNKLPGLPLFSE
jgi:hypothetical protein